MAKGLDTTQERRQEILKSLQGKSQSNFVFPDTDNGYWRMDFLKHLHKIRKIGNLPAFRAHDLRHTTGMQLRRAGVALETIKELLRHANLEDTLIYARYEIKEGIAAIRNLPTW